MEWLGLFKSLTSFEQSAIIEDSTWFLFSFQAPSLLSILQQVQAMLLSNQVKDLIDHIQV